MTYVLDQTGAELREHMRRITDTSGWDDPLATRLWAEVQALDAEIARLRALGNPPASSGKALTGKAQGAWSFDMEAAPRDGTRVLLWMQGCWIHPVIGYRAPSAPGSQRDCWREHGSRARIHRVDCWQPIPAPPASSGQEG